MDILVDGDILVFRAGLSVERTEYDVVYYDEVFDEDCRIPTRYAADAKDLMNKLAAVGIKTERESRQVLEPLWKGKANLRSMMDTIINHLQAEDEDVTMYLSGRTNFRYDVATVKPYKGNRKDAKRPTYEDALRQEISVNWRTNVMVGEEADDGLGIAQYRIWRDDPYGSVIVTIDKDLDMIPGLHYNSVKDDMYYVSLEEADATFWVQLLAGDPTDNIQGIPGLGVKLAAKALYGVAPADVPAAVQALYVQSYGEGGDTMLLEMARLIWIRREENQLWTPM